VISFEEATDAAPDAAWALISQPARWPEWAPHIGGAWSLGEPEVELGRTGAARLFGLLPVPARIVGKTAGQDWTWQVGVVRMRHRVAAGIVAIDLQAPGPLEPAIAAAYGPVIRWSLRRLARRAAAGQPSV
jgi:hypothetical protein